MNPKCWESERKWWHSDCRLGLEIKICQLVAVVNTIMRLKIPGHFFLCSNRSPGLKMVNVPWGPKTSAYTRRNKMKCIHLWQIWHDDLTRNKDSGHFFLFFPFPFFAYFIEIRRGVKYFSTSLTIYFHHILSEMLGNSFPNAVKKGFMVSFLNSQKKIEVFLLSPWLWSNSDFLANRNISPPLPPTGAVYIMRWNSDSAISSARRALWPRESSAGDERVEKSEWFLKPLKVRHTRSRGVY